MSLRNPFKFLKKYRLAAFITAMVIIPVMLGFGLALISHSGNMNKADTKVSITPTKMPQHPTLEIFESPVEVKTPDSSTFVEAKNKMIIKEGTEIQTGATGRAQVVFPAGTVTRIDNNGRIKITKAEDGPENIVITILKGRVWSRIKKLLGNESYSTETSNLVATVRGTSYGHGIVEGGFDRGTVFKGKVRMTCKKNKEDSLEVVPNKKALVNCDKETGFDLLNMDSKDAIDDWLLFNKAQDRFIEERFGKDTYADDDEVLGAETSVTPTKAPNPTRPPSPTPKPTTTSSSTTTNTTTTTSTNTPAPTATAAPTATPTDTPVPTPTSGPVINSTSDITAPSATSALVTISVDGSNLSPMLSVLLNDPTGAQIGATSIGNASSTNITASFDGIRCVPYTVTVKVGDRFSSQTVSHDVTVTSRC